ncbi:MAG: hypothetical protein M3406_06515 [Chloroflexota bacterium]|nr:hypothetical protein [Chloroflexota bacterium]
MTTPISDLQVTIEAPRELVFEMAGAVGGTLPGGPPHHAELISRDGDLLVVRYSAPPPSASSASSRRSGCLVRAASTTAC